MALDTEAVLLAAPCKKRAVATLVSAHDGPICDETKSKLTFGIDRILDSDAHVKEVDDEFEASHHDDKGSKIEKMFI